MRVLEDGKYRLLGGKLLQPSEHGLLRALHQFSWRHVERRMGAQGRNGQQRRKERYRLRQRRTPSLQQPLELYQLMFRRVVRIDAGRMLELGDDGVERSIAVVGRAVVAQAGMR